VTNWTSSNDEAKISEYKIKAVITAETKSKPSSALAMYRDYAVDFLQIPIDDLPSENIDHYFDRTANMIESHLSKGEPVLVHCAMGISRSVTLVLNYMLRKMYEVAAEKRLKPLDPDTALQRVLAMARKVRPGVNPNPGFMDQLRRRAQVYAEKCRAQSGLSNISTSSNLAQPMCDASFTDAQGKPANVITLGNGDFDAQGNLTNFKDVVGVVFFGADWCGFCKTTKPEFAKFASMLQGAPARAFFVDAVKSPDLIKRINPATWGYAARGFPTIVGYAGGKFYSEYGLDPNDPNAKNTFRKAEDFLAYAKGLGKAEVHVQ
jgi:thiol-disulfide isomerase/thioredoxin